MPQPEPEVIERIARQLSDSEQRQVDDLRRLERELEELDRTISEAIAKNNSG